MPALVVRLPVHGQTACAVGLFVASPCLQHSPSFRTKACEVWVHKVPQHADPSACTSPLEEWSLHNEQADKAAKWANLNRPSWFMRVYDNLAQRWHEDHATFLSLSKLHLGVAQRDVESRRTLPPEPEEEFVFDRRLRFGTEPFSELVLDRIPSWHALLPGADQFAPDFV